MVKNKSCKQ